MNRLLFELGVEDIPSNYLTTTCIDDFCQHVLDQLQSAHIDTEKITITPFITNRRMAVKVEGLPQSSNTIQEQISGPAKEAAFDQEGNPTKALQGFLRSKNAELEDLGELKKGNRTFVCIQRKIPGQSTKELLSDILSCVIAKIVFPKSMQWDGADCSFVRPIRWILSLYEEASVLHTVECEYTGIHSSNATYGHRFYAKNTPIAISSIDEYQELLKQHYVIVDHQTRYETIRSQIQDISENNVIIDEDLLWSLTYLCEWPVVFKGSFSEEYLQLPGEVLKESLSKNQKIFSVKNAEGGFAPCFVAVINSGKDNLDEVRADYENILVARLSDAQFFYQEDTKTTLAEKSDKLKEVMFLKGLGSVYDRQQRLIQLVDTLVNPLGLTPEEVTVFKQAASLCKVDLVTHMVYEFPSVQGVMGNYYAQHDGHAKDVAQAIEEHYLPRFSGDVLPQTKIGSILALLDKIDIIVGCFTLGLNPTGNQDPYALRRAMRGIFEIIREKKLSIDLVQLYRQEENLLPEQRKESAKEFAQFLRERLRLYLIQEQGFRYDIIDAVLGIDIGDILNIYMRAQNISFFAQDQQEMFWQACKVVERTGNIIKGAKGIQIPSEIDPQYFEHELEKKLFSVFEEHAPKLQQLVKQQQYTELTIRYVAVFADLLHEFFEDVLINVENQMVRRNRLCMMQKIHALYADKVADLSKIVVNSN